MVMLQRQFLFLRSFHGRPEPKVFVTLQELDSRLAHIKTGLLTKAELEAQVSQIARLFEDQSRNIDAQLSLLNAQAIQIHMELHRLKNILGQVTSGLGIQFEKYNKVWLEHFLRSRNIKPDAIIHGHREPNIGPWSEVEIDLFCRKPALLMECTSFLNKNEFDKVVKIGRIRDALSQRYGTSFTAYLATLSIHKRIRADVIKYCQKHTIELITKFS